MLALLLGLASATEVAPAAVPSAPILAPAREIARWPAPEAKQGVAVDDRFFYAISNNQIGKYDKNTGKRVSSWEGNEALFPHMNSCVAVRTELICAASNYPASPMASSVEVFDTRTMRHVRSVALPPIDGSLTWIEPKGTAWYAGFANYDDPKRGGAPGHDHSWTRLVKFDDQFRVTGSWLFPATILDRFAPMSNSGGSWGDDGLLYVTGHDLPELYALRLPVAGTKLEHRATIMLPTNGQAFAWDRSKRGMLWSIDRKTKTIVVSLVPMQERISKSTN